MSTEVTTEDNVIVIALRRLIKLQEQRYDRAYVRCGQSHSDSEHKTHTRQVREARQLLVRARNALADIESSSLATIAWQGDAHGHLHDVLLNMIGLTVTVVPVAGEPYDAAIFHVDSQDDDGELRITFHAWDDEMGTADPERRTRLNVWTELQRIEIN